MAAGYDVSVGCYGVLTVENEVVQLIDTVVDNVAYQRTWFAL